MNRRRTTMLAKEISIRKPRSTFNKSDIFGQIITEIQDVDVLKKNLKQQFDKQNTPFYLFKEQVAEFAWSLTKKTTTIITALSDPLSSSIFLSLKRNLRIISSLFESNDEPSQPSERSIKSNTSTKTLTKTEYLKSELKRLEEEMARLELLINTNNSTVSNTADRSNNNLNSPYSDSDEDDKKLTTAQSNLEEIPVSPILPTLTSRQNSFEDTSPNTSHYFEDDQAYSPTFLASDE